MRNLYYFYIILSFTFLACEKYDVPEETPACIIDKIKSLDKNSVCENPNIAEYLFQNEIVYVSDPGSCGADMGSIVYGQDCRIIGTLGGFVGNTVINGEEFSNAEFKRSIWEK